MLQHLRHAITCLSLTLAGLVHAAPLEPVDELARPSMRQDILQQFDQVRETVSLTATTLVGNAMGFLGVPYKRGGNSATTGFDCSGFVRATFEKTLGLILPRNAAQQAAATETIDKSELQPGDLVFFNTMRRTFSHVGIYIGEGKFIHSPKPGESVRVDSMSQSYWSHRFDGARRVVAQGRDLLRNALPDPSPF